MNPAAVRPRVGQLLNVAVFLFVAALLAMLGYRLTPPGGTPSALARFAALERHGLGEASLVLVTIDGLPTGRAGFEGGAAPTPTPQLDRLAAEAFRFEQAITPAPYSFAAHAALMTGRSPAAAGDLAIVAGALSPGRTTLAEALRTAGFRTAAFVGSGAVGRLSGLSRGFELFDEPGHGSGPATLRPFVERPADEVVAAARAWVDEQFRRRFFLWVQLGDPLAQARPRRSSHRRHASEDDDRLAAVDAELGRLFGRLSALGAMGHTIVVLASSHGIDPVDRGGPPSGAGLHDGAILVPALLRLPGMAARDRSIPEQVRLIDLVPTLLELLRVAPPAGLDGQSLVPLLDPGGRLDPLPAVSQSARLEELIGGPRVRALRWGGWKYIEGDGPRLYDVGRDHGERRDLSMSQTGKVAELQMKLNALIGAPPPRAAGAAEVSAAAVARLDEGLAALRAGEGARAARALEDLAALPSASPALLALAGAARRLEDRPADALPLYERALAGLDPAARGGGGVLEGLLLAEVGACRAHQGDLAAAIETYRRAVAALPDDPATRLELASACLEAGRAREALEEFHAALALAPDDSRILAGLGRAYLAGGSAAAAMRPLQEAIRAAPGTARPYFDLGLAYEALDRPADAARAYDEFLARAADAGKADRDQALDRLRAIDESRRRR